MDGTGSNPPYQDGFEHAYNYYTEFNNNNNLVENFVSPTQMSHPKVRSMATSVTNIKN